ncbi:hypothetical protein R1sor_001198 [Riccia sorocarpa]|uniref:MADS-box transcription factor n=1 Tax=Riccia sorocarpa TaxID=122646 RepID=A0ABD3GX92_9MARC
MLMWTYKKSILHSREELETWREVYKEKGDIRDVQKRLIESLWENRAIKVEYLRINTTPDGAVHEQLRELLAAQQELIQHRMQIEDRNQMLTRDLSREKERRRSGPSWPLLALPLTVLAFPGLPVEVNRDDGSFDAGNVTLVSLNLRIGYDKVYEP